MSDVVALQRAAAVWEGGHDGLIVAEDLQAGQEQRLTLAAWHHHLGERSLRKISPLEESFYIECNVHELFAIKI